MWEERQQPPHLIPCNTVQTATNHQSFPNIPGPGQADSPVGRNLLGAEHLHSSLCIQLTPLHSSPTLHFCPPVLHKKSLKKISFHKDFNTQTFLEQSALLPKN